MDKIVFVHEGKLVTDSLSVADVFGKEHKRVMQDIRELGCSEKFGKHNFVLISYTDSMNREKPKYILTEQGFTLLVMGYTGEKAMEFKERYIAEFERMRTEENKRALTVTFNLPTNYKQALVALLGQVEENERLHTENLMLGQRVAEYEPKASYVDSILKSKNTVTITQIAKDYGLSGQRLNAILHEEGVQYKLNDQWLLYRKHQDQGYTKSHTVDVFHADGTRTVKMNTRWLTKGRLFIHDILKARGILPNMDREALETVEQN